MVDGDAVVADGKLGDGERAGAALRPAEGRLGDDDPVGEGRGRGEQGGGDENGQDKDAGHRNMVVLQVGGLPQRRLRGARVPQGAW